MVIKNAARALGCLQIARYKKAARCTAVQSTLRLSSDEADGREVRAVGAIERGHVAEEGAMPSRDGHDALGRGVPSVAGREQPRREVGGHHLIVLGVDDEVITLDGSRLAQVVEAVGARLS